MRLHLTLVPKIKTGTGGNISETGSPSMAMNMDLFLAVLYSRD